MKYTSLMKMKTPLLHINYTRGQQSLDYQTLMEQTWPVLIHFQPQRKHNIYKRKLTCANSPEATTFFIPKIFETFLLQLNLDNVIGQTDSDSDCDSIGGPELRGHSDINSGLEMKANCCFFTCF